MNKIIPFKTVFVDVMIGSRFYKTIPYKMNTLFPPTLDDIKDYVKSKRPELKHQSFTIAFEGLSLKGGVSW